MYLKVNIKNVRGSQMAAKITGNFTIDDHSFRFTAIAFGRIGGQNIGAKISKTSEKELESFGYNVDDVIMNLQKNLLHGDLTLPEGLKRESFVDD